MLEPIEEETEEESDGELEQRWIVDNEPSADQSGTVARWALEDETARYQSPLGESVLWDIGPIESSDEVVCEMEVRVEAGYDSYGPDGLGIEAVPTVRSTSTAVGYHSAVSRGSGVRTSQIGSV